MATRRAIDFVINMKGDLETKAKSAGTNLGKMASAASAATPQVVALGVGAVAAATAFAGLIQDVTGTVDQVNTLAAATGLANETVNGLRQAARASGKDLKDILPVKLAKNMFAASEGAKAMAESFDQLGVDVTDQSGNLRNADDVFVEIIDSLAAMENRTQAAGIAATVLGKQGKELLTAFEDSDGLMAFVDASREFGIDVGPEALARTAEWQAATADLALAFDHAKQSMLDAFGSSTMVKIVDSVSQTVVFITSLINSLIEDTMKRLTAAGTVFEQLLQGDIVTAAIAAKRAIAPDFGTIAEAFEDAVTQANKFGGLAKQLRELGGDGPAGPAGPRAPSGDVGKPQKVVVTEWDALIQLQKDRARQQRLDTEALKDAYAEAIASLPDLTAIDQRAIADAMIEGSIRGAEATLQDAESLLRGVDLFGFGGAAATALAVARDIDDTIENLAADLFAIPTDLAESIPRLLTEVIPELIEQLPEVFFALLIELPFAIVKGLILFLPALGESLINAIGNAIDVLGLASFAEQLGEWWSGVWESVKDFFGNLLTPFSGEGTGLFSGGGIFDKAEGATFGNLPSFANDGFVSRTGIALVHRGDRISGANGQRSQTADAAMGALGGGGGGGVQNHFHGMVVDVDGFLEQVRTRLGDYGTGRSLDPFES